MTDDRYSRQTRFTPVGPEGQARIRAGSAVLIGCGALGSSMANALVRAGIGRLTIVDPDRIELSNLQRQTLFDEAGVGRPKAEAARERLQQINSDVALRACTERLSRHNAMGLIGHPTVVLDGSDNFPTRYLLNDYCVREGVPWIYGGVAASYGVAMPVLPGRTPCLRCVFLEPPPPDQAHTADTVGILAPIAHLIAAWQAAEALKLLSGHPEAIQPVLITADVWEPQLHAVRLPAPEPTCPCCGARRFEYLEGPDGGSG